MSDYEPPAEMVEAEAREVSARYKAAVGFGVEFASSHPNWQDFCRHEARVVLRRQHERERGLLEALRSIERMNYIGTPARVCSLALAAHAKLDAPKVPTLFGVKLTEVGGLPDGTMILATSRENYLVIKAAVEREEKR